MRGWIIVDGVLLALATFALAQLARLPRWVRRACAEGRAFGRGTWPVIALDLGLPLVILFRVPALYRLSWPLIFQGVPDIAWALTGSAAVLIVVGLTKVAIITRMVVRAR